jgi:hypothetical protein
VELEKFQIKPVSGGFVTTNGSGETSVEVNSDSAIFYKPGGMYRYNIY